MNNISISKGKKIFFISDFHLGAPNYESSRLREHTIVTWLEGIMNDCDHLFILGDIFDFWFEYKYVVPKGYIRLLGCLARFSDAGIPITCFTGNHDMWMFDYLEKELNINIKRSPEQYLIEGSKFLIGHGDGLGPGDLGYKLIKKIFSNKFCQWLFARLHPNAGIGLANYFSKKSRLATGSSDERYMGDDQEFLMVYAKEQLTLHPIDFFIFGHRHLVIDRPLPNNSRYVNIGDWIKYNSFASFDGERLILSSNGC